MDDTAATPAARRVFPAGTVFTAVDDGHRGRGSDWPRTYSQARGRRGVPESLNQLLHEMDGLREDAEDLFILTTNRPDQTEPALALRPGRIDQAIEFPLLDEAPRAKLYARGLDISGELMGVMVSRTKGVREAFVKELMRRCAQFRIESSGEIRGAHPRRMTAKIHGAVPTLAGISYRRRQPTPRPAWWTHLPLSERPGHNLPAEPRPCEHGDY